MNSNTTTFIPTTIPTKNELQELWEGSDFDWGKKDLDNWLYFFTFDSPEELLESLNKYLSNDSFFPKEFGAVRAAIFGSLEEVPKLLNNNHITVCKIARWRLKRGF